MKSMKEFLCEYIFLSVLQAIALLGASFASESVTLLMAIQNIKRKAKQADVSFYDYGKWKVSQFTNPFFEIGLFDIVLCLNREKLGHHIYTQFEKRYRRYVFTMLCLSSRLEAVQNEFIFKGSFNMTQYFCLCIRQLSTNYQIT